MAGLSGGQARLRIKGHRHSVTRFFLVGVGYTMVWITLSSELGYYSKLYQPQVLLQLNIAYYLPTIPVLILSAHYESILNRKLGECTSMFSRLLLGLTGCAVICAYFPFQPQRLSVLLGLVAGLGATSAIAFGSSYQLVAWFRAADTIALGLGCVGSGPLALLLQLGLGMTGNPLRWQWIAMFEVAAAFVVLGILAALSLLWQYGKYISGQESYLDAPLLHQSEVDERMTPEQQLEESTMRMMLPIRMFSVADPFQGMPLPPSTGLQEAMAEQPWRRLQLLRRVQSAAFSEDLTPHHSHQDGPPSAESNRALRKAETMVVQRHVASANGTPLQSAPAPLTLTRTRSSPREHSRQSSREDFNALHTLGHLDALGTPPDSPATPPGEHDSMQPPNPRDSHGSPKTPQQQMLVSPFTSAALVSTVVEGDKAARGPSFSLPATPSGGAPALQADETMAVAEPAEPAEPRGSSFTFATVAVQLPDSAAHPPRIPDPTVLPPTPRNLAAADPARSSPFSLTQVQGVRSCVDGAGPRTQATAHGHLLEDHRNGGLKKQGSSTLRDIEEAVPLLQPLDSSKEQQIGSIASILATVWMLVLGSLVSNIIFTVAFPFFTFARSSGMLGDRLPQALFYTRIFADLLGRLLPRRKALSLRQPVAVLVLAGFKLVVVVLYFLYLKAPTRMLHDVVPLLMVAVLWCVGGYINTNGYIMAPNMVAPKEVSVVSNMMVLTFKLAHFTGLLLAVGIAEVLFGGVAGDL